MSQSNSPSANQNLKPSDFAKAGHPSCSIWGKCEIECIALAYVQALEKDGDTWKRLTRDQVRELLSEDQRREAMGLLDHDHYLGWFDAVARQVTGPEGALGVRGFWSEYRMGKL